MEIKNTVLKLKSLITQKNKKEDKVIVSKKKTTIENEIRELKKRGFMDSEIFISLMNFYGYEKLLNSIKIKSKKKIDGTNDSYIFLEDDTVIKEISKEKEIYYIETKNPFKDDKYENIDENQIEYIEDNIIEEKVEDSLNIIDIEDDEIEILSYEDDESDLEDSLKLSIKELSEEEPEKNQKNFELKKDDVKKVKLENIEEKNKIDLKSIETPFEIKKESKPKEETLEKKEKKNLEETSKFDIRK